MVPALSASVQGPEGPEETSLPSRDYSHWRTTFVAPADTAQGDVYEVADSPSPFHSANVPPPPSYDDNMDPLRGNLYVVANPPSQDDTSNLPPPPSYDAVIGGNYQGGLHF